ncbi:HNH endonuclease [Clostridium tagluense]|uniref:HNH endonuclease n=1 Tax=Clostridium tagluense TaxID=360422 RepID=UPI0021613237|nr:HNH endonuclease [Clostridium tagluense]
MYPYLSNEDLSKIFNRSIGSIQHKATRIKLKKDKEVNSIIRGKSREGEKCCNWKGGRKVNKKGHVLILKKNHPLADINGYVLEHRYVMCEHLGRILEPNEIVHHINEIKTDNRIENLKLMSNSEHTILHHTGAKRSKLTKLNISIAAKNRRKKVG